MKVNQLPARALTPKSYAIEGGGSVCCNGPVLRNWTECHHTAYCTRIVALLVQKGPIETLRWNLLWQILGSETTKMHLDYCNTFLRFIVSDKFETNGPTFDDRPGRTRRVPRLNESGSSELFGFCTVINCWLWYFTILIGIYAFC
jgi:hypothetical protein